MARKSALIVDDSRTARRFLSRVLEQHQMDVQTAESAETALEILSLARPDVIFMDHMMPGMDGFQALRAIKNNPATATIPIMMYTSQSGELYVGQARALGAVGVLPKQIKPVEVSELLESLHLVPDLASTGEQDAHAAVASEDALGEDEVPLETTTALEKPELASGASEIEGAIRPGDWDELHRWLEEMLRHHGDHLRSDIEASMSRLLSERFPETPAEEEPPEEIPPPPPPVADNRRATLTSILVFSLAAIAGVFLWLHLDTQKKWQQVSQQNTALISAMDQARLAEAEDTVGVRDYLDAERASLGRQYEEYLATLEWSVNQSGEYAPDEMPLGDERLEIISGLLERLRSTGFTGAVEVSVHAGDFCLIQDVSGAWRPADPAMPVSQCGRVGLPSAEGFAQSPLESVAFANFRTELTRLPAGINLRVEDLGNLAPLVAYPANPMAVTALEWNRIAARNNRVQVRLLPADDSPELLSQEMPQR